MLNDELNREREKLSPAIAAAPRNERRLVVVIFVLLVGLLLPLLLAGCGRRTTQQPEGFAHFKAIAVIYGKYQGRHRGKRPKNLDDFKAFVEKGQTDMLSRFGVDGVEKLFVSPRDGEPLVFDFSNSSDSNLEHVIAYEKTGVGGTRVVVSAMGSVELLDREEFRRRVE